MGASIPSKVCTDEQDEKCTDGEMLSALRVASGDFTAEDNPKVIIGCWQLLERERSPESATETLKAYFDAGFTTFDTADIYGPSESIIGEFRQHKLSQSERSKLRVNTKYVTQDATLANAEHINAKSRESLKYVDENRPLDLVQFHWWDFSDDGYKRAAANLMRLQQEHKIVKNAVTNFDCKHLKNLLDPPVNFKIASNQVQYSLFDRRPENGLLKLARQHNFTLLCFGAVAGGWLSDRFLDVESEAAARRKLGNSVTVSVRMYKDSMDRWTGGNWNLYQKLLKKLRSIADSREKRLKEKELFDTPSGHKVEHVSVANVAALWVLAQLETLGAGGSIILGVRDAKHLAETVALRALAQNGLGLQADEMREIQTILDEGHVDHSEDIWSRERR
eukprot:gnl/TRDRNA2_/TRDRNA2_125424_c0_seq1.p1 gnl/TRDRNA2_/TRDRNA2_125424_c0~~gnl/TRDRNA2_/TRDRNA2_125424_c0_seq1.p1  ORF type:complete len:392 (+),score=69.33 gnl/TRDRNA2_/TRDRNA2_125424_c0_seq1:3-1178(+)